MKFLFAAFVLVVSTNCLGQQYLRDNERVILSFQTNNHKQVYLVKDQSNKYITYRFGSKDKLEFEYPAAKKNSWRKFTYSFYLRGGGKGNEGMDLNYVYFTSNGFQYVIYQTYQAIGNKSNVGVKVIDVKTSKPVDIRGNYNTTKGSLAVFRDNKMLKIGDQLFD